MKNIVTNTTEEIKQMGPAALLLYAPGSGGIEASEKRGQAQLVQSDVLPFDLGWHGRRVTPEKIAEYRKPWEAVGFKFGEPVKGDPLFVYVTLPDGWTKVATGHDMWSDIRDERGRKRGGIFYKAAFYDRDAHAHLECRLYALKDYEESKALNKGVAYVRCGGSEGHPVQRFEAEVTTDLYDAEYAAIDLAKAWLAEHYPDHEDPTAYWDVDFEAGQR